MIKYFLIAFLLIKDPLPYQKKPSDREIKKIIMSKIRHVLPESIELSEGEHIPYRPGIIHWRRTATFTRKTEIGNREYCIDLHFDHQYKFTRIVWGEISYLQLEEPDFSELEKVLEKMPDYLVAGLDGRVREVSSIKFNRDDPDAVVWSGDGKEVTLKFQVEFVADGRTNDRERWKAEQNLDVRFFKESRDSQSFLYNRLYIDGKEERVDKGLIEVLSMEAAKLANWEGSNHKIPKIKWK